jgi:TonB family protein
VTKNAPSLKRSNGRLTDSRKNSANDSSDQRDETQRSLGCVGASAMAHIGLLIAVALAPSFKTQTGEKTGTQAGIEFAGVETANASPAPNPVLNAGGMPNKIPDDKSQPLEVMLADANDPNAVALPQAQTLPPAEAALVTKPAEIKPETIAAIEKPAAEKPAAAKPIKAAKQQTKSNDIAKALKAERAQAAIAKAAKAAAPQAEPIAADVSPAGDIEAQAPTEAAPEAKQLAEDSPLAEKKQIIAAADEEQPTTNEPAADEIDDEQDSTAQHGSAIVKKAAKEDDAVPLRIALPENEALTTAQENALQAPATQKAAATPAAAATTTATRSTQQGTSQAVTAPAAASFGKGQGPAAPVSRGGGATYSVPIGAPVRDARTLIAMGGNPKPIYPLQDKIAGRQGTAILVAKVRQDGSVENVTLEKSSGSRMMDESAATAFRNWKYRPGQEGYVRLPVQFQLVGDAKIMPAQLQRQ